MKRAYVFETAKSKRCIFALECIKLTAAEAQIPGHVKIGSIKPGMVLRRGRADRPDRPDMGTLQRIEKVVCKKGRDSIIQFNVPAPSVPVPQREK